MFIYVNLVALNIQMTRTLALQHYIQCKTKKRKPVSNMYCCTLEVPGAMKKMKWCTMHHNDIGLPLNRKPLIVILGMPPCGPA